MWHTENAGKTVSPWFLRQRFHARRGEQKDLTHYPQLHIRLLVQQCFRNSCHHPELKRAGSNSFYSLVTCNQLWGSLNLRVLSRTMKEGCGESDRPTDDPPFTARRYHKKAVSSLRPGHIAWAFTSLHLMVQAFYHFRASQEG